MQDGSELVRYVVENIVNTGQLVSVPEYLTPDYSLHKTGLSVPAGPEAFKMAVRQWRSAFPDYHLTVEATIAEGDLVACRYIATGTHRGSLMGMPASDRGFAVHGTDVHRLVDGRIAESWLADDIARLLHDLGLLRPVASGSWT